MSTAHRPTWVAALGGTGLRDGATSAPTNQHSSKDMPAHTKLKYRQIGQDAPEEIQAQKPPRRTTETEELKLLGVADQQNGVDEDLDADTDLESDVEEIIQEAEESEDEDDEEDETEELLRELEKIKREREAQKLIEAARKEQDLLSKNPLINLGGRESVEGFAVKRRWDDDVVFKNQAKGVESKPKKRFINDTTRSDFHRKFLDRYIL